METTNPVKERLKKKLNKKESSSTQADECGEKQDTNIFDMLTQVSSILKTNPEMVNKVNECVSKIISNRDLMTKLSTEIKNNIEQDSSMDDQILDNKSLTESVEALENESMQ